MGTSCKKIHILKKIRMEIRKKIQEDTFNDPVSTPYGKASSSLRPDSFLKSLIILKMFALAALVQKFVRMTSDFKKLFTGPGNNYILRHRTALCSTDFFRYTTPYTTNHRGRLQLART